MTIPLPSKEVDEEFYFEIGVDLLKFLDDHLPNNCIINYAEVGHSMVLAYLSVLNVFIKNDIQLIKSQEKVKALSPEELNTLARDVMNFLGNELMKKGISGARIREKFNPENWK